MANDALWNENQDECLTLEDFSRLELGQPADLVDGKVKLMGNNNPNHGEVLGYLVTFLKLFLQQNQVGGKVFCGDTNILVRRGPDTGRGADLAYVSAERMTGQPANVSALHVAPVLIVEIMSPGNAWEAVMEKLTEYFEIGVSQVWVVTNPLRMVTVFSSPTESQGLTLAKQDTLTCPEILPGFELPLATIFEGLPSLEQSSLRKPFLTKVCALWASD